ncbi:MAG TPA: pre-peptidase C-terminal domain-containing protein [Phycisphaerae bacterium]|nr:pre-peptidase C-terminal domain-containing protein [Phycisphaerae bacterium]
MRGLLSHRMLVVLLIGVLAAAGDACAQTTWYVDDDNCPGPGSGTMADPFCTIQEGIDLAVDGDTVLVLDGTYTGVGNRELDFGGRLITVRSANGAASCVIDCQDLGRGFYFHNGETAAAVVEGFTITNGSAYDGGGMCNENSSPTVTDCTFSGNAPVHYGGGMYNSQSSPTVTQCTFSGNWAESGGGIFNSAYSNPTLTNCTFDNNTAKYHGGGMRNYDSSPTLTDCSFTGNLAWAGGAMRNLSSDPILTNCTFTGNSAVPGSGGGMENENSIPTLTNCTFSANSTAASGGGMKNSSESHSTLTNCTFSNNTAEGFAGGGMYNSFSNSTLANCIFSGNTAVREGGGIANYNNSNPTLTDCTFIANTALGTDVYTAYGGGMASQDLSSPTVTNCTFIGNTSRDYGGAMTNVNEASPTLINCTFSGNEAFRGGAMFNYNLSDAVLANCMFHANHAGRDGGALNNASRSNPVLANCIFSENRAESAGGVMHIWNNCTPALTNCTLSANSAPLGNALACNSTGQQVPSTLEVTNCILWDGGNEVWNNDGSAIVITYSDVQAGWLGVGNIDCDPLFADPANGDYHLKSNFGRWDPTANAGAGDWVSDAVHSPCIDAGDPSDSVGDEPEPNGSTVNMGSFGGTEFASKSGTVGRGDLVVTSVDVLATPVAGRALHVAWDVVNDDPLYTAGAGFFDGVYLSSDDQWGSEDMHLATLRRDDPVGPQQGYHAEADVVLPGVLPNTYHILVRTDLGNHVNEPGGEDNNVTASGPVFVEVDELIVGTAANSQFTNAERARYFRVAATAGKDLQIRLDDLDDVGTNELYASFETIPTRSQFDYRDSKNFGTDQQLTVPNAQAGTYYVLAYASSIPGITPSEFSIIAEYLSLQITSLTPSRGGNASSDTLSVTIEGACFREGAAVVLRRPGETNIPATHVTRVDSTIVFAGLDLQGAAAGIWELLVINPDSETASIPFTVIEGGTARLETKLILPSALGFNRHATLWIEYANIGDAPMPAPLLKLHGDHDALLTADESLAGPGLATDDPPAGLTDTIQVLALGSGPDPGVLGPGDTGQIPVYYRGLKQPWQWEIEQIDFQLGVLTADDATPIDWPKIIAALSAASVPDPAALVATLQAQIGGSGADFTAYLAQRIMVLNDAGTTTSSLNRILFAEMFGALWMTGLEGPSVHQVASEMESQTVAVGQDTGEAALEELVEQTTVRVWGIWQVEHGVYEGEKMLEQGDIDTTQPIVRINVGAYGAGGSKAVNLASEYYHLGYQVLIRNAAPALGSDSDGKHLVDLAFRFPTRLEAVGRKEAEIILDNIPGFENAAVYDVNHSYGVYVDHAFWQEVRRHKGASAGPVRCLNGDAAVIVSLPGDMSSLGQVVLIETSLLGHRWGGSEVQLRAENDSLIPSRQHSEFWDVVLTDPQYWVTGVLPLGDGDPYTTDARILWRDGNIIFEPIEIPDDRIELPEITDLAFGVSDGVLDDFARLGLGEAGPGDIGSSDNAGSYDPNEKIRPVGYGQAAFLKSDGSMAYTIYFENESDATAAAIEVQIVDQLDSDLDWTTFELLEIGFGPHQFVMPSGMPHYEDILEIDGWTWNATEGWHTGETPLIVDIQADIDIVTGQVTWHIISYDPETGWEPDDAYAGFLPPDDPEDLTHRGEGYVSYRIRPKPGLATGTQITNGASIIFDANPPIDTPQTLNTIDDGPPSSHVLPLPASITTPFTVEWTGQDDEGGCGIATYEVYVSVDGGPFGLWVSAADNSAAFPGQIGCTYAFYSMATDNVDNREQSPQEPDATTTVASPNNPPVITCNQPVVLWSPNHKLTDISSAITVEDPDGDPVSLVIRAFSDEPEISDLGDDTGGHAPDFKDEHDGGRGLLVRAERQGTEDGRFYILVVAADDGSGDIATAVCTAAVVPHDKKNESLEDVLAQAAGAASTIQAAIDAGDPLPPLGLYEHGLSDPLGPKQ